MGGRRGSRRGRPAARTGVRAGNGAGNGRLLLLGRVGDALAGEEGGTTLRGLDDDGRLGVTGGLERGDPVQRVLEQARSGESRGWFHRGVCDVHGGARGDVDGGHRKALGAGVGRELNGTRKVESEFRAVAVELTAGKLGDAHPEDIIAVDDAGLEVKILHETHFCDWKARKAQKGGVYSGRCEVIPMTLVNEVDHEGSSSWIWCLGQKLLNFVGRRGERSIMT